MKILSSFSFVEVDAYHGKAYITQISIMYCFHYSNETSSCGCKNEALCFIIHMFLPFSCLFEHVWCTHISRCVWNPLQLYPVSYSNKCTACWWSWELLLNFVSGSSTMVCTHRHFASKWSLIFILNYLGLVLYFFIVYLLMKIVDVSVFKCSYLCFQLVEIKVFQTSRHSKSFLPLLLFMSHGREEGKRRENSAKQMRWER